MNAGPVTIAEAERLREQLEREAERERANTATAADLYLGISCSPDTKSFTVRTIPGLGPRPRSVDTTGAA